MDIYSFIKSKDVAAYCREINKTWNTFEMVIIIERCYSKKIIERHKAWRELIDQYPDMAVDIPMRQHSELKLIHSRWRSYCYI